MELVYKQCFSSNLFSWELGGGLETTLSSSISLSSARSYSTRAFQNKLVQNSHWIEEQISMANFVVLCMPKEEEFQNCPLCCQKYEYGTRSRLKSLKCKHYLCLGCWLVSSSICVQWKDLEETLKNVKQTDDKRPENLPFDSASQVQSRNIF